MKLKLDHKLSWGWTCRDCGTRHPPGTRATRLLFPGGPAQCPTVLYLCGGCTAALRTFLSAVPTP